MKNNITGKDNITFSDEFLSQSCNNSLKETSRVLTEKYANARIQFEVNQLKETHEYEHHDDFYLKEKRQRKLQTLNGEIILEIPRFKNVPYSPSFCPSYQRRDESTDELITSIVAYSASVRDTAEIIKNNGIKGVSYSTASRIANKFLTEVETFQTRRFDGMNFSELIIDAMYFPMKHSGAHGDYYRDDAVIRIIGLNEETRKFEHLLIKAFPSESAQAVKLAIRELQNRGLKIPPIITSDAGPGIRAAIRETLPYAIVNPCLFHEKKSAFDTLPRNCDPDFRKKVSDILEAPVEEAWKHFEELKEAYPQSYYKNSLKKVEASIRQGSVTRLIDNKEGRKVLGTSNRIECYNGITRRRINSIRCFPSVNSAENYIIRHCLLMEKRWENRPEVIQENVLGEILDDILDIQEEAYEQVDGFLNLLYQEARLESDSLDPDSLIINIVSLPGLSEEGLQMTIPVLQIFGDDGKQTGLLGACTLRTGETEEIIERLYEFEQDELLDSDRKYLILIPYGNEPLEEAVKNEFPKAQFQYCQESFKEALLMYAPPSYKDEFAFWFDLITECRDFQKARELCQIFEGFLQAHKLDEAALMLREAEDGLLKYLELNCPVNRKEMSLKCFSPGFTQSYLPSTNGLVKKPKLIEDLITGIYGGLYRKRYSSFFGEVLFC